MSQSRNSYDIRHDDQSMKPIGCCNQHSNLQSAAGTTVLLGDMSTLPDSKERDLLSLPVDILKEILKHLTHTNDLASAALTHSVLHSLVTPIIYSRFDIVWPESHQSGESHGGVDALTYGLATLNMAEDVFEEAAWQRDRARLRSGGQPLSERQIRVRRGNNYASYVRKFCLGNGPSDWIEEYYINKESGKMLGTLVALALARMKSLESFVWDMPTGILREVWQSLAYLGDRADGGPCRLHRIWVRWHRNTMIHPFTTNPALDHATECITIDQSKTLSRVEHPSFSILSPVRSLSVLDIDEVQYLDEMSVLIGKSIEVLRELRVGIASLCRRDDWTRTWSDKEHEQIDLSNPVKSTATIGGRRRGGVLGVLTSAFLDLKQQEGPPHVGRPLRRRSGTMSLVPSPSRDHRTDAHESSIPHVQASSVLKRNDEVMSNDLEDSLVDEISVMTLAPETSVLGKLEDDATVSPELHATPSKSSIGDSRPLRLQLHTLELERVSLSMPVLKLALDWSIITSLTILNCPDQELLWYWLHEEYSKDFKSNHEPKSEAGKRRKSTVGDFGSARLHLKKLHVNNVLPCFMRFARECLAPNTLESLFLQETDGYDTVMPIDSIFNGIVKRHRGSLSRLLVTSCKRKKGGGLAGSSTWKSWAFKTEHLTFVTSGRMPRLRELGMCIGTLNEWRYFVQRLPGIPHLRSLYLPRYSTSSDDRSSTPRDMALHVLDAVTFNPEMELCYVGIASKCYEIVNAEDAANNADAAPPPVSQHEVSDTSADEMGDEDDDDDDDDADSDNADGADDYMMRMRTQQGNAARSSMNYDYTDSESESEVGSVKTVQLDLREILFYDDKVDIFRIRHGRL